MYYWRNQTVRYVPGIIKITSINQLLKIAKTHKKGQKKQYMTWYND